MIFEAGSKIPVEELEESVVSMYKRDLRKEFEQVFVPFKKICKSNKVSLLTLSCQVHWNFEVWAHEILLVKILG